MTFSGTTTFLGNEIDVPEGSVVSWVGEISEIPTGWFYCDGNNGTPNLKNKYLISIQNASNSPGAIGGQNSYDMSDSQIPSHNHSSGNTGTNGNHSHTFGEWETTCDYSGYDQYVPDAGNQQNNIGMQDAGNHSHSLSSSYTGGSSNISNEPRHREVIFIQKR